MISLRALGKAEIITPTDRLTPSQELLFATGLYLFLERAKPVSRTTLAETLWPGNADSARQHRMRQTVFQLKNAGMPLLADRETVFLPPAERESDLDVLFIHGAGDIDAVESLHFLPGYAPHFSEAFSRWLDSKRAEVSAATSRLLINDVRRARSRGDWLRVERLALKCMDVDPFNEEAVLARAEASAMRGAKREAVSILDRYVADLGPGSGDIKLPANLMRKRIAERVPESAFSNRTESIFVGRENDMHQLTALLDDTRSSLGRCCMLWGDAGIGKSRLASELGRFGELQGVQVRRVACRRGDSQRPLSVFVDVVPQLREMRGALGCSPDTLADLQRLTQFDAGGGQKPALEMDPQSIFELIRLAIFDLIDAVSEEQCLMLVIEDVHWIDAASARILGQIADWAAKKRLFLLFTSRLRENPLLEACTRAGLVTHHVMPLSNEAATVLVSEMFEATNEKRDEEFLAWCRTVGDGNPFFLHELVKQWLETKQRHAIPPSITTVIRERFSRLSLEARQLLQACSILGESSTMPRVEKMLEQEPYKLLSALEELAKASMLSGDRKPSGQSPDFRLAARHDLVANVAVHELDPHGAAFLHRRAAEVIEAELGEESQDTALLWACAQHWQKAGDEPKSLNSATLLADHLISVGHPSVAAEVLQKVVSYCSNPGDKAAFMHRRLHALELAHDWPSVCADILAIRDITSPNTRTHDDLELTYFDARWRCSFDFGSLVSELLVCVAACEASPAHRVRAGNLALKAGSDLGDIGLLHRIFELISPLFDQEGVSPLERCEATMVFHCNAEDGSRVRALAADLVKVAEAEGNPARIASSLRNAGYANLKFGFNEEGIRLLTHDVAYLAERKLFTHARHASYEVARAYLDLDEIELAKAAMSRFDSGETPPSYGFDETRRAWAAAKLAIAERDIDTALHHFQLIDKVPAAEQTALWRTATLAMRLRLALLQQLPAKAVVQLANELMVVFATCMHVGRLDYEAVSIVSGLTATGNRALAKKFSLDYAAHRKELSQLPTALLELLEPSEA